MDAICLNVPDIYLRDPELRDSDQDHREDGEEGEDHREDVEDPGGEGGLGILEQSPDMRLPYHPPSHLPYHIFSLSSKIFQSLGAYINLKDDNNA